jgi:hypothetical protein
MLVPDMCRISHVLCRVLIDMYVDIGDSIALQYGGSEAHKKVSTENSQSTIAGPIGKVCEDKTCHVLSYEFQQSLTSPSTSIA